VQHLPKCNVQDVTGQDGFRVGYEENRLRRIDNDPGSVYRLPNFEIIQQVHRCVVDPSKPVKVHAVS